MAASLAQARDVTVRSGEHDGYTRLVFQIPSGTEWVLSRKKNGARLSVELDEVSFDTASVFQRLTQARLATISQSEPGATLEMQFGCDCVASAFLYKETMIVVDIAPGKALPPLSADIPPPALPKVQKEKNPLLVKNLQQLELPLLNLSTRRYEDQLSNLLLRGADREIVDLHLAPVGPRSSTPRSGPVIPSDLNANINVTSVLDGLNELLGPSLPQLEKRPPCISTADLGFATWAGAAPFPEQVASLRSSLFQEFDRIDTKQVLKLAKLYAYSGFGAEALQALDLLEKQTPDADRIAAISRYLDGTSMSGPNPFAGLQRCESDAAIWAVLIEGMLAEDAKLQAIEQSFVRLPDHLRRHIGPTLAEILADAGKLEAARRVLRSVDRVETDASAGTTQAEAKVAAAEGDGPKSEALLSKVIETSGAELKAPLALARLIEKRWLDRGSVSPKELDLAASYVVEFRRTDIGAQMLQTQIVALSLSNEFDQAMDLLQAQDAAGFGALDRVALILTERADDATFLRRVVTLTPRQQQALSTDTALAVAERLVALGFANAALELASRPQDKARRSGRARVRAQAALLQRRPHQAILELSDDPSDAAQSLRGQAMQMTEDYGATADLFREIGQVEEADRYVWLADRPDRLDEESGSKFSAIHQTTQVLSAPPNRIPEKPLADAQSLLEDSAQTRERILDLLAKVTP